MRRVKYLKTRILIHVSQNVSTCMGAFRDHEVPRRSFVSVFYKYKSDTMQNIISQREDSTVLKKKKKKWGYSCSRVKSVALMLLVSL